MKDAVSHPTPRGGRPCTVLEANPNESKLCPGEFWLALIGALLLGALAVGRALWDGDTIYLATDTASVQAPWHATSAPQNAQLSDSGVAFYPHYRRVSERWLQGDLPLWNPDLYAGVPLLANPQWGVLDPQVAALVVLDALGGQEWFDRGFAWLALLRIAAAALGTYLLARSMGLGSSASSLAAVGYSLSGSVVLWLGFSLSHVTPCLPWLLFGIETLRSSRRLMAGWVTTSVSLALAIYGGHPEVAFFTGLCGGLWCLRLLVGEARRLRLALGAMLTGVLMSAPSLVPFLEYLSNSGALVAHKLAPSLRGEVHWYSLLAIVLFLSFHRAWRKEQDRGSARLFKGVGSVLLGVNLWGLLGALSRFGAEFEPGLNQLTSIERGSSFIAFPILALALSALLDSDREKGRPRSLLLLAPLALAMATSVPGIVDLWRWLPLVGLAAPARAACVAALAVSLLAGFGLQFGKAAAHRVVLIGLALCCVLSVYFSVAHAKPPQTLALDRQNTVVVYEQLPDAGSESGSGSLQGVIHGGLRADSVRLRFEKLGHEDALVELSDFVAHARLAEPDDSGSVRFDFGELDLAGLGPGRWRLRLEFERGGELLGQRYPCLLIYPAEGPLSKWGIGFAGVSLLALLVAHKRPTRKLFIALVCGQGLLLTHSWNPTVPLEAHPTESATERFLADAYPGGRFVADPGILPGNTALLAGLTTIGGYDALDVASFDGFRMHALKPGRNPLLHWNVDGFDMQSPGFRLFGVELLLSHVQRQLPGWRLVAGPELAPTQTELFVYECEQPLPRSFCVPEVVLLSEVLAKPAGFDPARMAFLGNSFALGLEQPFETSTVRELERAPERLRFEVELDGEGLFVSTEQHFPGWKLWVNGTQTPILRVNSIFRGVFLNPGKHELRFEYQPESWGRGLALGAAGLLLFLLGLVFSKKLQPA